jgi:hypothetical protein
MRGPLWAAARLNVKDGPVRFVRHHPRPAGECATAAKSAVNVSGEADSRVTSDCAEKRTGGRFGRLRRTTPLRHRREEVTGAPKR